MANSKLVCRGSGKFCRKPSHAIGIWLLLATSAALFLLCFTYIDVRSFYNKNNSNSKELHAALQRGALGTPESSSQVEDENSVIALESPAAGPDRNNSTTVDIVEDEEAHDSLQGLAFNETVGSAHVVKDKLKGDELQLQSEVLVMPAGHGNETTKTEGTSDNSAADRKKSKSKSKSRVRSGRCDISRGQWVYDEAYPLYRSRNCPFVDPGFRCEENGRPDTDFMKYRWQPHACDLPRFDPRDMLERLRDQRLVFVGDSLGRNQWESMLCMLAEGVQNKSRIYETSGEPISKHVGSLVFRFQDYNCTVEYYRDPFLVPQTRPPPQSPENVTNVLKIDQVSWSVPKWWPGANILVLNSGHWWSWEKIFRGGGQFQMGNKLTNHNFEEGFQVAFKTWALWMEENIDPKTTQVFFRSYASVHFRGGSWNTGGHCDEEVKPLTDEEVQEMQPTPWTNKHIVDAINQNIKTKGSAIEFMDITTSTDYRADGHAGLYTKDVKVNGPTPKSQQDCSHFCLPGVPDTWNEFLYATLLARGQGVWGEPVRY